MKILYKKILMLELWHDFYLGQPDPPTPLPSDYDLSRSIALIPTPDCLEVLRNLRWVFRPQAFGANLFVHVDEAAPGQFQTVIPVDRSTRLSFWLLARDRAFANFTNLPLTANQKQIYYFSNLSGNQGRALFLTQPLLAYAANAEYAFGQLVTHADRTLESSVYQVSAGETPDAAEWETLPASQYVTGADRLSRQGIYRSQTVANANPGDIFRWTLVDANQQESWAVEVMAPDDHRAGAALPVSLNFAGQRSGRYRLLLNGGLVDEFVLVDPNGIQDAFALVEIILNQTLVSPAFALLQPQNRQTLIQPKTYVIRFKNRATRWRYHYERPHGFCLENQSPDVDRCTAIDPRFIVIDPQRYTTRRSIGLRQRPDQLLNDGSNVLPIPNTMRITPEVNQAQRVANIFSDVYL